jgi:outer membrane murein-binding lipoprotein Lpp
VSDSPSTVDLSPAASAVALDDAAERIWWNAPVLAALARLETMMTQSVGHLTGVVDALGAQLQQLTSVVGGTVSLAHQQQQDLASSNQRLADLGQQDEAQAARIEQYETQLQDLMSQLAALASPAPTPAPAPAPEPTPAP